MATIQSSESHSRQRTQAAASVFLDQLEELAETGTAAEFFRRLVIGLHECLSVNAVSVWSTSDGQTYLDVDFEDESLRIRPATDNTHPVIPLVESICETGHAATITPNSQHVQSGFRNTSEDLLVVQPSAVTSDHKFAIAATLPANLDSTDIAWSQRLLEAVSEVSADFYRRQRLVTQVSDHQTFSTFREFAREVHLDLNLERTSHQIVNESQRLLACDRVQLFVIEPWQIRLGAVSGVYSPDTRSLSLKLLKALVNDARQSTEVLEFRSDSQPSENATARDNHRQQLFEDYQKESKVHRLQLLPLTSQLGDKTTQTVGILAVEDFEEKDTIDRPKRLAWIAEQAGPAVHHCQVWNRRGLRGLTSDVRGVVRTFGWLISIATLIILSIALTKIQTDFEISADGVLQPENRRYIFAPETGKVIDLAVSNEQPVKKDQQVVEFENPELLIRRKTLLGEQLTAETELDSIIARRLNNRFSGDRNSSESASLAALEKELRQKTENLKVQIALLDERMKSMSVKSPIDGYVFRWDLETTLKDRPVQQGDRLIMIADIEGPWNLVLDIADRDINHVTQAQKNSEKPLGVSYVLGTSPDQEFEAELGKISSTTELTPTGQFVTKAMVPVNNELQGIRPGASVHTRIHCGRRSVGYVWFRELIEFLQRRFYL